MVIHHRGHFLVAGLAMAVGLGACSHGVAHSSYGSAPPPSPAGHTTSSAPSNSATGTTGTGGASGPAPTTGVSPPSSAEPATSAPDSSGAQGLGAAAGLVTKPNCLNLPDGSSRPQIELLWTPGMPMGDSQRVDVTKQANGSGIAKLTTSGPLSPQQNDYALLDLKPGDTYTWRVITTRGGASIPSQTKTFVVETCPSGVGGGGSP